MSNAGVSLYRGSVNTCVRCVTCSFGNQHILHTVVCMNHTPIFCPVFEIRYLDGNKSVPLTNRVALSILRISHRDVFNSVSFGIVAVAET